MLARPILAGVLALFAAPVCAEAAGFEQRVVAILNAGGTADTIQGRLSRVRDDPILTADQRVAIDAMRILVRTRGRPKGLSLTEAEAFAARNSASPAADILIAEAALANDQPQRSADALITAAARAGSLVQLVSPVTVSKLSGRLEDLSDTKRTADLAKALLYGGWSRGSASLRSFLALSAIRDEVAAARVEHARRLLPAVKSPASLHMILIDDRLAPLRGDVAQVAGPRLERAWRQYLQRTRDEWLERGDVLSATAYAEALKQANQHEALIASFLLRFMRGYNCPSDLIARSVAADLADSLVKSGRWTRAEDVMRRSGGVSPAVYAAMLLERGEFRRAGSVFERSLRAAGTPKDKADERAIAWLRAASACAAFRRGERVTAAPGDLALLDVSERLFVLLCMDRGAEARASLLSALVDEQDREDALRWVQPFTDPVVQSDFRKQMSARIRALQRDQAIVEAASRYGTILDWPLTAGVPQAAELATGKAPTRWQCGDQSDWETGPTAPESIRLPDSEP